MLVVIVNEDVSTSTKLSTLLFQRNYQINSSVIGEKAYFMTCFDYKLYT